MAKKLVQTTDYTLVTKRAKDQFLIQLIYPNEDSVSPKDAITIWTSHHLYNPKEDGSIDNFVYNLECKAYIEDGPTVESFIPSNAKWYKSQNDLEQNLFKLQIGDIMVAPYK